MIKEAGKVIFSQVSDLIGKQYARFHYKRYATLCRQHNIAPLPKNIKKAYIKKWEVLAKKVDTNNLRLFGHYVGLDLNIVPEDIVHNVIEQILNPPLYRAYYTDKNMADKIFPSGCLPKTLLRKINSSFFHADYSSIPALNASLLDTICKGCERIILKPTVGTNSGKGVELFTQKNGIFYNTRQEQLDTNYLQKAGPDLILQECLKQSAFMEQFNPSSVNSFRILAYRSVTTNEIVIPNMVMKIGAKGSYLDNAHAGGIMIGISAKGELNKYGTDQYGNKYECFNDIRFSSASFIVPDFEKLIETSKAIARNVSHHRVLNLDMMINEQGEPKLIECNFDSMSSWYFHFNNGPSFGAYTEEIINYCAKNLDRINRIHIIY